MTHVNYYTKLGLDASAGADDIKRAYRKLARKYHPDVNKDSEAEEKLKQINEANDVLKDPEKRKIYDRYGVEGLQAGWQEPARQGNGNAHRASSRAHQTHYRSDYAAHQFDDGAGFGDFFEELFSKKRNHGERATFDAAGARVKKPAAFQATLELSLEELYHQGPRRVSFVVQERDSSGTPKNVEKHLKINLPKGIKDQGVIRLPAVLKDHSFGNGDLQVKIVLRNHPRFRVAGYDLYTSVVVTPWDAALGATVSVKTVTGSLSLAIPPGSHSGRKLRLRQQGLPKKTGEAGHLYVEIKIDNPDPLTDEQKGLFEELQQVSKASSGFQDQQVAGVS